MKLVHSMYLLVPVGIKEKANLTLSWMAQSMHISLSFDTSTEQKNI